MGKSLDSRLPGEAKHTNAWGKKVHEDLEECGIRMEDKQLEKYRPSEQNSKKIIIYAYSKMKDEQE